MKGSHTDRLLIHNYKFQMVEAVADVGEAEAGRQGMKRDREEENKHNTDRIIFELFEREVFFIHGINLGRRDL